MQALKHLCCTIKRIMSDFYVYSTPKHAVCLLEVRLLPIRLHLEEHKSKSQSETIDEAKYKEQANINIARKNTSNRYH